MIVDLQSLKATLVQYTHRPGDAGTEDVIPIFIEAAERRIDRELRTKEQEVFLDPLPILNNFAELPTDFICMRSMYVADMGRPVIQTPAQLTANRDFNVLRAAVHSNRIEFAPAIETGTVELIYYARVKKMLNPTDTNSVLLANPMLYLYACMYEFSLFAQDDGRISIWQSAFMGELDSINETNISTYYSGGALSKEF